MLTSMLVFILGMTISVKNVSARDYYVSPEGNDTWSGKRPSPNSSKTDGPFATVERARNAIRAQRQETTRPFSASIQLRAGYYFLTQPLEFISQDSGTEDHPFVIRSYKGERACISGGRVVNGFQPVDDPATLKRLSESSRGNILVANLRAQGITNFGTLASRGFGRNVVPAGLEMFFKDKPMTLARYPNAEWLRMAAVPDGQQGGKFTYEGDRPAAWASLEDVWVHGYWTWDWADSYEKIKSLDPGKKEISTEPPHGVYGYSPGKRFYFLNILEELDAPGEWYLDRKEGLLYFWPPEPPNEGDVKVSIIDQPLISLNDASHVTIEGLIFECGRATAVTITEGKGNKIAGCTIRCIGNHGIFIKGGEQHGVQSCDIYYTGDGGIHLEGGDRKTLSPGRHYADNNEIHDYNLWSRTYRPAVHLFGVGHRVTHNHIHDSPHTAILLHGNQHLIEFNDIHHVCMETSDAGAFYLGRDWTERENVVRYNYFHELGSGDVRAIYLDDWASGVTVYGNVLYKAKMGVCVGGGRNNLIENNLFVDCVPAIHVDARGLTWAKNYFDSTTNTLVERLQEMNYREPPYSERYPELLTLYEDEPALPKYNTITKNVFQGGEWLRIVDHFDPKILDMRDNLTDQDPLFVDAKNQNFKLKRNSPALKMGFKQIPIEKIGLYRDRYRRKK